MSTYIPPALNAVDFALTTHTVPSIASPQQALSAHTVPALNAVNFELVAYTPPTYMDVGWELLPSGGISYTLVCNAGAYTYLGQSVELTVARNFALSAGAYSYAGSDATLTYVPGASAVNYTLDLATGTYSYTGNDIEFTYVAGQTFKTGGKGDNPKSRSIYKPTGLVEVKKKKKQEQQIIPEVIAAKQQLTTVAQVVDIKTPQKEIALTSLVQHQTVISASHKNRKAIMALLLAA